MQRGRTLPLLPLCGVILAVFNVGCSRSVDPALETATVYSVATRQLPPEPVYDRTGWSALPQPLAAEAPRGAARLSQKKLLHVSGASLQQTSERLGALFSYRTYCAASIANRSVTIKHRGDIDELAEALAESAAIRVVVDHENRELRLFAFGSASAR